MATVLTANDVAAILDISDQTARMMFRDGTIAGAEQVGGRGTWVLPAHAAHRLIEDERSRLRARLALIDEIAETLE